MYRTDADGAVASKPARPAAVDPVGYFDNGTVVDYGFLNSLMDEVVYAIQTQGITLDRANDYQLATAIRAGMKSFSTAQLAQSTDHDRAAIVSSTCVLGGTYSAAVGAQSSTVGDASSDSVFVAATMLSSVLGICTTVLASNDCDITTNSATNAAIIAASLSNINSATTGFIAAAYSSDIVSGTNSAIIASTQGSITGGNEVALIATSNCTAPSPGDTSAIIGSTSCNLNQSQPNVVILASSGISQTQATGAPSECVMGGTAGDVTWRIASASGTFYGTGDGTGGGGATAAFIATGADFAELFDNYEQGMIAPGTLVTRIGACVLPAGVGDRVIGVVSTHPAMLGNASAAAVVPDLQTAVGLTGRLPVRVSPTVKVDDFLEPGPAGVAQQAAGETRIEVMKILSPGIALCLVR